MSIPNYEAMRVADGGGGQRVEAVFSGEGYALFARPVETLPAGIENSPILTQMHQPWSLENYSTPREPVVIGKVEDRDIFSQLCPARAAAMPIKLPNQDEFVIPIEFLQFKEVLQMIIDVEAGINPRYRDYYTYLTVDQRPVVAGNSQRAGGVHVDGQQLYQYPNTNPPEQEYLVTDALPTKLYPGQSIDFSGIDATAENARTQFNAQIVLQIDTSRAVTAEPYEIVLFDSYIPHESTLATEDIPQRTFVRVDFSPRKFAGEGNNGATTMNPLIQNY